MITTEAKQFVAALKESLTLARKQAVPVLGFVRVTNNLMTATDLDTTTIVSFPSKGNIDCLIPYHQALEVLNGETGELTIDLVLGKKKNDTENDNPSVKLKVNGCEYSFESMNVTNFPQSPEPVKTTLTIEADEFQTLLKRTVFAISNEESRYTLNGALLKTKGETVIMVATDGHRLSYVEGTGKGSIDQTIIPKPVLEYLKKNVKDSVSIGVSGEQDEYSKFLAFQTGNKTIISSPMSGQFPNYEAVMPRDLKVNVTVSDSSKLLKTLTRVSKCADPRSLAVKWVFGKASTISAQSMERGSASALIDCVVDNPLEGCIGWNSEYIQEFIKAIGETEFTTGLRDAQSAAAFKVDRMTYVVMPMRI